MVKVSTAVFDGPFDLLLHLILKDEVDLYQVSLSEIVEQYLEVLAEMESLELERATEFLLIAATLVELKSRRLLPDPVASDLDDELALWEERDLLLARLLECKTFKDAAKALQGLSEMAALSWPRRAGLEEPFIGLLPDLMKDITAQDIHKAFVKAMTPKPIVRVETAHIAPISLSVADAVSDLAVDLVGRGRVSFRSLTAQLVDRLEIVVYFLAILELYKQDLVEIKQFNTFGDIELEWAGGEREVDFEGAFDDYEG